MFLVVFVKGEGSGLLRRKGSGLLSCHVFIATASNLELQEISRTLITLSTNYFLINLILPAVT